MKTAFFATMILALLAGSLAACQSTAEPITINEQDAGKTITLKTGDTLLIERMAISPPASIGSLPRRIRSY